MIRVHQYAYPELLSLWFVTQWLTHRHTQLFTSYTIIIIIITTTMFMVLSSWHSHCESSPSSFDECRLSAGWPPTLRPNQPIWAVSPPIGCYHPQTPSPFIIITQLVSWYSFYCPFYYFTISSANEWCVLLWAQHNFTAFVHKYLTAVKFQTPVILLIKYWMFWHMEHTALMNSSELENT